MSLSPPPIPGLWHIIVFCIISLGYGESSHVWMTWWHLENLIFKKAVLNIMEDFLIHPLSFSTIKIFSFLVPLQPDSISLVISSRIINKYINFPFIRIMQHLIRFDVFVSLKVSHFTRDIHVVAGNENISIGNLPPMYYLRLRHTHSLISKE